MEMALLSEVVNKDRGQVHHERWFDWRWHMANRIRTVEQLGQWIDVTEEETAAILACKGRFKFEITPYYAALMARHDARCPVRQQAIPSALEFESFPGAEVDPVGDCSYRRTNRVVHKYPDRAILLVTETCPVYCRHCTRKFHTTAVEGTYFEDGEGRSFDEDFAYIESTHAIRDVLLTGGDPLVYNDRRLEQIVSRLRAIPHVEIIRIGTRFPVVLPQRITHELCEMLQKYHPIWLNTHFNHPKEITAEAAAAVDRLLRHGIPVGNQTVLLKGINDDVGTMRALMTGLVKIRVRPYYLYHCDNVTGVSHFVTSIEAGKKVMAGLLGHTTGFAAPNYVITTRLGKIPITTQYVEEIPGGCVVTNYQGRSMEVATPDTGSH